MALFDFLTKFQDKYKHSSALSDFKKKHIEFKDVPDEKLAGALSTKYPDEYGYLKDYDPQGHVPAELVPNEARTKEFYQKNPKVKPQAVGLDILSKVRVKYPQFKDVPDEKLSKALETKYPGRFPGLAETTINEKYGSITVDTQPEGSKTVVDKIAQFMGLAPTDADQMTDADAVMSLSKLTGFSPSEVQNMGSEGQRELVRKYGGIKADPTNFEFYRKLVGMSALAFGGTAPVALLKGVLKFQAVHTAISESIKIYKGYEGDRNITNAWGLLDEKDISDLAGVNATSQQKELFQMIQFAGEIGIAGAMNKKALKKLGKDFKGAGEKVVQGAIDVGRGVAEGVKVRAKNKAMFKDFIQRVERRGGTKASQRAVIRDAKAVLNEKVITSSDPQYDSVFVGEINKMRSTFQIEAKAPVKTGSADLGKKIISPEHKVIRKTDITLKDYSKAKIAHPSKSPAEIAKIVKKINLGTIAQRVANVKAQDFVGTGKKQHITRLEEELADAKKGGDAKEIEVAEARIVKQVEKVENAVKVEPERFQSDRTSKNEKRKPGDIQASNFNSEKSVVTKPFTQDGKLHVAVSRTSGSGTRQANVVELVPEDQYKGESWTYKENIAKVDKGQAERGSYEGIKVTYGGKKYVLANQRVFHAEDPFTMEGDVKVTKGDMWTTKVLKYKGFKASEQFHTDDPTFRGVGREEDDIFKLELGDGEAYYSFDKEDNIKSFDDVKKYIDEHGDAMKKESGIDTALDIESKQTKGKAIFNPIDAKDVDKAIVESAEVARGEIVKAIDHNMYVTSGARTSADQERIFAEDPDNAAKPGTSKHEENKALDIVFMDKDWVQSKWKSANSTVKLKEGEKFLSTEQQNTARKILEDKGFVIKEYASKGHIHIEKAERKREELKVPGELEKQIEDMTGEERANQVMKKYNADLAPNVFGDTRPKMKKGDKDWVRIKEEHDALKKESKPEEEDDIISDLKKVIAKREKGKTEKRLKDTLSDTKEDGILEKDKGVDDGKSKSTVSDGSRTTAIRQEISQGEAIQDEPENRAAFGASPDIVRSGKRNTTGTSGSEESELKNIKLSTDKPVELTRTQRKSLNKQAKEILEKAPENITEAERDILRQYTGAGGLQESQVGVLSQHYTPYSVINFIWDKIKALGVKIEGASALEASEGVGSFLGFKPEGVSLDAVEMDETSSKIASILYPEENHFNMPFEKYTTGNYYDISIGNDPFGNFRGLIRYAEGAEAYASIKQIHDFFIAKRLDLLKPNGILTVIVSTGTMDKMNKENRESINKKAVFLGAYRLPLGAFRKNTQYEGSADILIFRKRVVEEIKKGTKHLQDEFINSDPIEIKNSKGIIQTVSMSRYFKNNPDKVWGKVVTAGQFGAQVAAKTTKPIEEFINKALKDDIKYAPAQSKYTKQQGGYKDYETTKNTIKSQDVVFGSFVGIDKDGELLMAGHASADGNRAILKSGTKVATKGLVKEKLAVAIDLMDKAEQFTRIVKESHAIDKKLQSDIKKIAKAYSKKYGKPIGYDVTVGKLKDDPRFFKLAGIMSPDGELVDILTKDKLDIGTREIAPFKSGDLQDAVRYVKETTNSYSTTEIAKLMEKDVEAVERELVEKEGWNIDGDNIVPDAEYLYGDLIPKLEKAFEQNLDKQAEKLKAVMPEKATKDSLDADPIYLWVPEETLNAWLEFAGIGGSLKRVINPLNGVLEWEIKDGSSWSGSSELNINNNSPKGSIEKYLNHVKETDTIGYGRDAVKVYSPEKTAELQRVRKHFENWFKNQADSSVTDIAVDQYNRSYNSYRRREPDATPQDITGISKTFKGSPLKVKSHQWEWVAQATDMRSTINAHGVGGGKTMAAILLAQLSVQNNTAKRKMLLVPAKVIRKWAGEIQDLFPSAKILSLENLSQNNAYKMLQQVAMNDFDFVLISTDRLKTIPIKGADKYLQEDIDAFEQRIRLLNEGKSSRGKKRTEKRLQEDLVKMKEKLAGLQQMKKTNTVFFEDLNIDMLIVDEAHNYKNVYVDWGSWSTEQSIVTQNNSERAADLWYKTRVMRDSDKGNIHFLTATPTPNNPIEIYAMIRYLAPEEWTNRGIMNAGDFVDQFTIVQDVGIPDVTGMMTTKKMISGYKNLKALREIFKKYVDFRRFEDMAEIERPDAKYNVVEVPISKEQMKIGAKIVAEMNFIKENPKAAQDQGLSLLALTTQSRQNAVGADVWNGSKYQNWKSPNSKIAYLVNTVMTTHKQTKGSGQLVFLDLFKGREPVSIEAKIIAKESGIPIKMSDRTVYVNYHKKVRKLLVEQGIPENKVAIVNGETNNTPKMKQKIMDDYNDGKITILIGTTKSMGEGMDLQADTVAIHNVDVPWTPDELTQRNGRGVRQGNRNDLVSIYNYVTKGSLDAFMYGKLNRKDKWNKELWLGSEDELGNINLDKQQGLSYEELSESLTVDKDELIFWENVRQSEAMRSKLGKANTELDKISARLGRIQEDIAERQTKISGYEREIVESDPDKDTSYLTARIDSHKQKVLEQEVVLAEATAEEEAMRNGVKDLKKEIDTIDAAIQARGGVDEDELPEVTESAPSDEEEPETNQSVDDIIDAQTKDIKGLAKGSIVLPSGVDFSGFRRALLTPWNKALDWLWKYNYQERFDPTLAERFRKTTIELAGRVNEAIIEVNNRSRGKQFTIKDRVKATFAVEEKSFYDSSDQRIKGFADIFINLFSYVDTQNKDRGIYKTSFLDRVIDEAIDKKDKLQTKIDRYSDENSTYNKSYRNRQAEKFRQKLEKVNAEIEQIRDLRFVSHKNVVQAVLDNKISRLDDAQRRVWLSNARRLSFKYKHRKGITPLREYLKNGLLKPEDIDLVKVAMQMLSEAQFRWTMKDLFDYAKESGYIVSARSLKKNPQAKNWSILNPLKHGIVAPEYNNYRIHPVFEDGLVELKATLVRKGGFIKMFYGIIKMGQFIKPMIIWKYDLLQAALGGALGVKTPLYLAKAIQLWIKAKVNNAPSGDFREGDKLGIFQRAHIPVVGSKSEDEAVSMAAKRTMADYPAVKKVLEGLLDMPLTIKNSINIIKVAYKAIGNVTWGGDEIIRLSTFIAYKDMGYSAKRAAYYTSQWHGAYGDISTKARDNLGLIFFVYAFRFLMPRQIFRLIYDSMKVTLDGLGYTGGKLIGKGDAELPRLPEKPDVLRVIKGIAALIFLILGVDYMFRRKGFTRARNAQFWKWVKTTKGADGVDKTMVVALNLIYNQIPKQIYRALYYDPTKPLPRGLQGIQSVAKWELHPLYRIIFWDIATNRKSIGAGQVYNPNAIGANKLMQISKYFITESLRLFKVLEEEPDVTEAYKLEEKDKQSLWDATLKLHEQLIIDAFGYRYITRNQEESYSYSIWKVKREYQKRQRYARTKEEQVQLQEWVKFSLDYFERLYGQKRPKPKGE